MNVKIAFRGMEASPALEQRIREHALHLTRFSDEITSCDVVVELPHRHKHRGALFHARIDLKVPDGEIVAGRNPSARHEHEDPYTAVNDAFRVAGRQLQDYVKRRRSRVKHHEPVAHGNVMALFPYMDYGLIETPDAREIYFHRNSITNADFDSLQEGQAVRFSEEQGEQGPQASSVVLVGKHHIVP